MEETGVRNYEWISLELERIFVLDARSMHGLSTPHANKAIHAKRADGLAYQSTRCKTGT